MSGKEAVIVVSFWSSMEDEHSKRGQFLRSLLVIKIGMKLARVRKMAFAVAIVGSRISWQDERR